MHCEQPIDEGGKAMSGWIQPAALLAAPAAARQRSGQRTNAGSRPSGRHATASSQDRAEAVRVPAQLDPCRNMPDFVRGDGMLAAMTQGFC